jgi:hypothetical protein
MSPLANYSRLGLRTALNPSIEPRIRHGYACADAAVFRFRRPFPEETLRFFEPRGLPRRFPEDAVGAMVPARRPGRGLRAPERISSR